MIWNSVILMTVIDLTIIGIVVNSIVFYLKNRQITKYTGNSYGSILLLSGLIIIGLFYLYDLFVMHLLPHLVPQADAMKIMTDLHLNYSWVVTLLAVGSIVSTAMYLRAEQAHEDEIVARIDADQARIAVRDSHDLSPRCPALDAGRIHADPKLGNCGCGAVVR